MNDFKHWLDGIFSVAAVSSFFSIINSELPNVILWLTAISLLLSIIWWFYRFYGVIFKKYKVEDDE